MDKNKNQFVALWIGKKLIFKEPLSCLKNIKNTKSKNKETNTNLTEKPKGLKTVIMPKTQKKNNPISAFNRASVNQKFYKQMAVDNLDVIPKFVSSKCMVKVNQQIMQKFLKKKEIFNKITSNYLSSLNKNFNNEINEISKEIECDNVSNEASKNDEYKNFNNILSIINSNKTDDELINLQKIPKEQFTKITDEMKTKIINGIILNGEVFSEKLDLYSTKILKIAQNKNNNYRKCETMVRKKNKNSPFVVSNEQINLFKIFVGNNNIDDNQIITFFDMNNPKVKQAGERYFQNYYSLHYLELYFHYPNKPQIGIRQHNFNFTNEVSDLFTAAQEDCMTLGEPKLYLEDGRQIFNNDKKYKCIGSLYLYNLSKIYVYFG